MSSEINKKVFVKKVPYALRAIFLGVLGIHEFYAGRKKKGLIILAVFVSLMVLIVGSASLFLLNPLTFNLFRVFPIIFLAMLFIFALFMQIQGIKALFTTPNENGKIEV